MGKTVFAQQDSLAPTFPTSDKSTLVLKDSIVNDTLSKDTLSQSNINFTLSNDALDQRVEYGTRGANDSILFDYPNSLVYLYGDAYLIYGTMSLDAGFIRINLDSNTLTAEGIRDSSGRMVRPPHFKDKDQEFTSKKMRYNFKTKKGIIYDAVSKYSELFIRGSKTKFLSAEGDSTLEDDVLFNSSAIFTTCDHPQPHYGIRSNKIKIIPGKLAVIGPSRIELDGLPTPFWIPFGFFPISPKIHSGLIFPRDYTYERDLGYGLRNIGWYFAINDYMDFTLLGDIYFNTPISYRVSGDYRYNIRYKYNGRLNLGYSKRFIEPPGDYHKNGITSFSITYSHNQDSRANPYHHFGGSINIRTNGYDQLNYNNAQRVSQNSYNSNLNYRRTFPGKRYSLTVGLNHSQSTKTGDVRLTLPQVSFNQPTTSPFKELQKGHQWYDDITASYSFNFANELRTKDSLLLTPDPWSHLNYDIRQNASTDYTFKVLKYIHVTPNAQFTEYWHFRQLNKTKKDSLQINGRDTSRIEYIVLDTISKFTPFHEFSTGISANTSLYKTLLFKKGFLKGLRHKVTPSINFNYSPDYKNERYQYFKRIDTDPNPDIIHEEDYSIFLPGVTGTPSPKAQSFNLSYSIGNNLEAKYFSKRDSSTKKVKLFDYFNINGNYNFSADSFQWSPVSFSSYMQIIKGITSLRFSMGMDPYALDVSSDGREYRSKTLQFERNKLPLRFDYATFTLSTRSTLKNIYTKYFSSSSTQKNNKKKEQDKLTLFKLVETFTLTHDLVYSIRKSTVETRKDITRNTLTIRGNIPLTDNWAINVNNIGYNFITKDFTYPDVGISRNLHCWQMRFNWQPQRGTYSFFLGVKPGTMLDFIKVPYNRTNTSVRF